MLDFNEAVEFLRERLFEAFSYGCHLTAKAPIVINPAPVDPQIAWEITKAKLLEGDDLIYNMDGSESSVKKQTMSILLDNTFKYHQEQQRCYPASHADSRNNMVVALIRRAFPSLIANEIVGVQPMTGPVGMIYMLRMIWPPEADSQSLLRIEKETVEARSQRLRARYALEIAQDATAQRKEAEAEIVSCIAQEVVAELDQSLLSNLRSCVGEPTVTFDMANLNEAEHPFIGDRFTALAIFINREASRIAKRTRRGSGNRCVLSPTALTILKAAKTGVFAPDETDRGFIGSTRFVGTLHGIRVYVDHYAADDTPVLVGYKDKAEFDAGFFYCPYQLLDAIPSIDAASFQPVLEFKTRYGYLPLQEAPGLLGKGTDYLSTIGINADTLTFI